MKAKDDDLYPFYQANIHEDRFAARVVRAVPLGTIVFTLILVLVAVFKYQTLLLFVCTILNVSVWLWVVSCATFGLFGANQVRKEAAMDFDGKDANVVPSFPRAVSGCDIDNTVQHVVVLPNYKEDEEMLADTLQSLSEASSASSFIVILAMEEREAESKEKADRLIAKFSTFFQKIFASFHPGNLKETHLDGSEDEEVPGKASNVKWAVGKAKDYILQETQLPLSSAFLTVADADVFFHPMYFRRVEFDVQLMRQSPGDQHLWTMWQAPQLPYRNYYMSPAPSRVWGYISSIYEFGGVASLGSGGHHMVFSAYSTSLQLASDAAMWDGDIIAEDHHAYIKAFFYSVYCSAKAALNPSDKPYPTGEGSLGCRPALRVRAIMLPVKSTSVASSEGVWQSYVERWHQATRHTQGVAELSYSLLVFWDMLCTLPLSMYNLHFITQLFKVLLRPFFMHLVPLLQTIALGVLSVDWFLHNRAMPGCPDKIWMASSDGETLLCGFAGAWALTWPVLIPLAMVAWANYRFIRTGFLEPSWASTGRSRWHDTDGGIPPTWGAQDLTLLGLILLDNVVLMAPLMIPYGLIAEVLGCWNVLWKGNHFKYVTAAKALSASSSHDYGTMTNGAP
mmetsp:Transcript_20948/g.45274  ORF Transcript_20948/g.45274 Transcript_20948/m.45274 type:complete len:622 (-) Transcript_20948:402-2267(-)